MSFENTSMVLVVDVYSVLELIAVSCYLSFLKYTKQIGAVYKMLLT